MRSGHRIASIGAGAAAVALFLAVPPPAKADIAQELATAEAHAGYAVAAADLKMVQTHLRHVVNCMVGPKGRGYDAAQANPCKDQGEGVMPDFKGDKAKRATLQKALDTARAGLHAADLAAAKQRAVDTDGLLKKAM
jgi:hypothetical protein